MSVTPRLNRLFAADGKCLNVAMDHGFFNEGTLLTGLEDIAAAVKAAAAAGPDVIQLTVGQARHLQAIPGPAKPALALRTDVANCYNPRLPAVLFSEMIAEPVARALALDAACVVVNLLQLRDQPELHRQCVANICALKPDCEQLGMPLMVEPLVMQPNEQAGGYMIDGDVEKIIPLVRQAVELGADVIKADPCDDLDQYGRVVETAGGIPVLVRGGGKVDDAELLARTHSVMAAGARGIVYGRNIVQHESPPGIVAALMAIVHRGLAPEAAAELISRAD